ncbi:redoxin domain-containing protein [Siccirubricoccus phaeus]|uniref:redoxin domain-containing protein n=1 Tax=Siccirubricoccus phaeus TaxID=2595053 RepID=UPI0011F3B588|nr:redoxin domain-containing protein [Siccirubricoccus phaeus]
MTTPTTRLPFTARRRALLLGGAGLAVAPALLRGRPAQAAPAIGQPAPAFSAQDSNGRTQTLEALRGKLVVLEWTNHECPFVQKHYRSSNMQTLQREVTGAGAAWLSVISSAPGEQGFVTPAQANELSSSRQAVPTAVLLDPEGNVGRAYGAQTTPHMYVIGADGRLLYMGGIDSIASTNLADLEKATPYFRNAFRAVAEGKPVQQAVTRPYGCSVKYAA